MDPETFIFSWIFGAFTLYLLGTAGWTIYWAIKDYRRYPESVGEWIFYPIFILFLIFGLALPIMVGGLLTVLG